MKTRRFYIILIAFGAIFSCIKFKELATLTTNNASNITTNSFTCGGNITNGGGADITARGVCWSTSQSPAVSGSHTNDGTGTGSYTSNITGLTPGTKYYIRAYATNNAGTAYGNEISCTTTALSAPTVITVAATEVGLTSAKSGGTISSDGGAPISEKGVCWSTIANPTTGNTKTSDGTGTDSFISNLTGLEPELTYHVRAYATNSAGTAYGDDIIFSTTINGVIGSLIDISGNIYKTIGIGTQVWMAENLNTSKFNDNSNILFVNDRDVWKALTSPGYRYINSNDSVHKLYGALYNFYAISTGKLCPTGWHVPSNSEWSVLVEYLGGTSIAGGKMKEAGTIHWFSPNEGATNESGFTALPGGYSNDYGSNQLVGDVAWWWSATEVDTIYGLDWYISNNSSSINGLGHYKGYGFSVRCIRD